MAGQVVPDGTGVVWYNRRRMDEIAEKIALRNRVMRRMYLQLTPEQRVERMRQLHEWGLQRFRDYPEGFANFVRRNLARRAINRSHGV